MSKLVFRKRSVILAVLLCGFLIAGSLRTELGPRSAKRPRRSEHSKFAESATGPPQGQQNPQNPQSGQTPSGAGGAYPGAPGGMAQATAAGAAGTAQALAIRNFLQNRPEVMEQLKLLLVQRLRAEGSLVDEQTISDQAVVRSHAERSGFPHRSHTIADCSWGTFPKTTPGRCWVRLPRERKSSLPELAGRERVQRPTRTGSPPTEQRYDDSVAEPQNLTQDQSLSQPSFGARFVYPVSRAVQASEAVWLRHLSP